MKLVSWVARVQPLRDVDPTQLLGKQKKKPSAAYHVRTHRFCWKKHDVCWSYTILPFPIGSMYAIYGNIYHQYTPNVSIYTIHGSYGSKAEKSPVNFGIIKTIKTIKTIKPASEVRNCPMCRRSFSAIHRIYQWSRCDWFLWVLPSMFHLLTSLTWIMNHPIYTLYTTIFIHEYNQLYTTFLSAFWEGVSAH